MRLELSKEWCLAAATREGDHAVGAGIPPSLCGFCCLRHEPVKLRRGWVHHFPDTGRLIACAAKNLKPGSN